MEAYKAWVRQNHQWLGSLESIANTLTWMLPERISNSVLVPEIVSSVLGLVSTLNQHIIDTTPRRLPGRIDRNEESTVPWPLLLSIAKELEVLVEIAAEHYLGADMKWTPVAVIEAIKALLRFIILHENGYKMLLDGGETMNTEEAPISRGSNVPTASKRPAQSPLFPHSATGIAMQALHKFGEHAGLTGRPSWTPKETATKGRTMERSRKRLSSILWKEGYVPRLFLVAEGALILRPLIYVLLIRRHGLGSWKPWLLSLTCDFMGITLLHFVNALAKLNMKETNPRQGSPCCPFSDHEKQELRRRQLLWTFYLLRSPFFEQYSRNHIWKFGKIMHPLPLFGTITDRAIELFFSIQSMYSYTAAS